MLKKLLQFVSIVVGSLFFIAPTYATLIDTTNIEVSTSTKQQVKSRLASESYSAYVAYVDWHTPSTSSSSNNCATTRDIVKMYQDELGKGCGGLDGFVYTNAECNAHRSKKYQEELKYAQNIGCM